ncbi:MAG: MvaI/BcnI family restriction endonuclease [Candidatus Methanofastidiosia archaeon]
MLLLYKFMLSYNELVKKLKEIKNMSYVVTHRKGDTGIGKTLEDLLGIRENNIPGPNGEMIELKPTRKDTKSMLTLFTKFPLPRGANSILLKKFGYKSAKGKGKKELHTTISATSFNTLRGEIGFKIDIKDDRIELVSKDFEVLSYWDKKTLKESFEKKFPKFMYVKAETKGKGSNEEFWFNEVWVLSGFDFRDFLKLLKEGTILVDIRIGQYSDGRPHDHGTAFRISPDKLNLCFKHRKRAL